MSPLLPLVVLALTTSVATAESVEQPPRRDFYVGANLIAPADIDPMDDDSKVSVEGGARLGGLPLFVHAEAGTGFISASAGLEVRLCSRGTFFVCGSAGLDAAYTAIGPDTVARFTFELGTTVRLRLGIDVPKTLQQTPQTDGAYVLQPQLKGGLAYLF